MTNSILLNQVEKVLQIRHLSPRTQQSYLDWIYRFFLFFDEQDPMQMGALEIKQFPRETRGFFRIFSFFSCLN